MLQPWCYSTHEWLLQFWNVLMFSRFCQPNPNATLMDQIQMKFAERSSASNSCPSVATSRASCRQSLSNAALPERENAEFFWVRTGQSRLQEWKPDFLTKCSKHFLGKCKWKLLWIILLNQYVISTIRLVPDPFEGQKYTAWQCLAFVGFKVEDMTCQVRSQGSSILGQSL